MNVTSSWDPELTDEEENEVDEYNFVDFGVDYDDDFIFEKAVFMRSELLLEIKYLH